MANTDLRFDIIYNNLPVLQEGFEYYTLSQLVDSLEVAAQVIDYSQPKYIRISHLFTDYRKCEIDYEGIAIAPLKEDIHYVMGKGEFASFVDGKMKVGRISKINFKAYDCYPVDKTIYHFTPSNSENHPVRADYILRELLSDYVADQAKHICSISGQDYLRLSDYGRIKIAVPSIEKQDAIIASERYTTKKLSDVLEVIDSLFDKNGIAESQKILQNIFSALYTESELDSHLYYNPIRKVLEWMFRAACQRGLVHDKCFDNKGRANLTDCYRFMAGRPTLHSGVICRTAHFPVIIANNVQFILDITGGGSHTTTVPEKENPNLTAYWAKIDTPYLLYSLTFLLCDIIIWFGQYVHENEDVDKNKAMWRDLVLKGEVERGVDRFLYVGDCKLSSKLARTCMEGDYVHVTRARENEVRNSSHLLIAEEITRYR